MPERSIEVPVLIVGGGPTGLVSSILLSQLGIKNMLVERRSRTSEHPKAHVVNMRSMEILSGLGLKQDYLLKFARPEADASKAIWCNKLVGPEIGRIDFLSKPNRVNAYETSSAAKTCHISQSKLEPILLEHAKKELNATIKFSHQWQSLEQINGNVISTIKSLETGEEQLIKSDYVIAADGAASSVRASLGIAMKGPDALERFVTVAFEANMRSLVPDGAMVYWILNPEAFGVLIPHSLEKCWVYMHPIYPAYESPEDYTPVICEKILRQAIGAQNINFKIKSIRSWTMAGQLAETYKKGRVLLVGDAAHRFPPTGGLGMNTGIADAHNLAWKIHAVLKGMASDSLLDTYERERRPPAQQNTDASIKNYKKMFQVVEALGLDPAKASLVPKILKSQLVTLLPQKIQKIIKNILLAPAKRKLAQVTYATPEAQLLRKKVQQAIDEQWEHFDVLGLAIGYQYEKGAIVSDGTEYVPPDNPVEDYNPTTRPGARLPHAWLKKDGVFCSTHDLLDYGKFTLIMGKDNKFWSEIIPAVCSRTSLPIQCISIDSNGNVQDELGQWKTLSEIEADGAILVRPDGHVAWRSKSRSLETLTHLLESWTQIMNP